jgi:DNA-binding Lrp family transcriptional regulator
MVKFDDSDYALLMMLMKNSHKSDRQLAKLLGLSQPTVTRRRAKLENNFIDEYTVIPKWEKIGFELVAFTFVKSRTKYGKAEKRDIALQKTKEWYYKQPNVVLAYSGQGMGWDGICVSFHKNYSDYVDFIRRHDSELSDYIIESQSFIADINPGVVVKPLSFKYLAETK